MAKFFKVFFVLLAVGVMANDCLGMDQQKTTVDRLVQAERTVGDAIRTAEQFVRKIDEKQSAFRQATKAMQQELSDAQRSVGDMQYYSGIAQKAAVQAKKDAHGGSSDYGYHQPGAKQFKEQAQQSSDTSARSAQAAAETFGKTQGLCSKATQAVSAWREELTRRQKTVGQVIDQKNRDFQRMADRIFTEKERALQTEGSRQQQDLEKKKTDLLRPFKQELSATEKARAAAQNKLTTLEGEIKKGLIETQAMANAKSELKVAEDLQRHPEKAEPYFNLIKQKELAKAEAKKIDLDIAKEKAKSAKEVAGINAQARIKVAEEGWKNVKEMLTHSGTWIAENPKTVVAMVGGIAASVYASKTGFPMVRRYIESIIYKPKVDMETSKTILGRHAKKTVGVQSLDDFIATPELKHRITTIAEQIKTARAKGENLKNIMFEGPPGTGKTMCAKAIAAAAGTEEEPIDYAITSGSQFAKLKDNPEVAVQELKRLLDWAKRSRNGLIVFIDEAESLFADRTLPTTAKWSVDMLNAFLQAIDGPTHPNVMFILATNHAFKLDTAMADRIGDVVTFDLPGQKEREDIIKLYLEKFTAGKDIEIDQNFVENIPFLAHKLDGTSPRRIKYVVEETVRAARMKDRAIVRTAVAKVVTEQEHNLFKTKETWQEQRTRYMEQIAAR